MGKSLPFYKDEKLYHSCAIILINFYKLKQYFWLLYNYAIEIYNYL